MKDQLAAIECTEPRKMWTTTEGNVQWHSQPVVVVECGRSRVRDDGENWVKLWLYRTQTVCAHENERTNELARFSSRDTRRFTLQCHAGIVIGIIGPHWNPPPPKRTTTTRVDARSSGGVSLRYTISSSSSSSLSQQQRTSHSVTMPSIRVRVQSNHPLLIAASSVADEDEWKYRYYSTPLDWPLIGCCSFPSHPIHPPPPICNTHRSRPDYLHCLLLYSPTQSVRPSHLHRWVMVWLWCNCDGLSPFVAH